MFNIIRFFKSKLGMRLLSILLGLGLASLFKMSCDSRSCIVFKAAELTDGGVLKYNDTCYKATERLKTCDPQKNIVLL